MKNFIGITTLAFIGLTHVAGAQASLNSTLNATAAVGASLTLTGTSFDFGTVYRNQGPKTIAATAANAGFFAIGGTGASTVTATLAVPPSLTSGSTTATMPIAFTFASIAGNSGSCTTAFASGGSITLDGTATTQGNAKLCVGGTVTPALGQTIATDYLGVVSVTVAFP